MANVLPKIHATVRVCPEIVSTRTASDAAEGYVCAVPNARMGDADRDPVWLEAGGVTTLVDPSMHCSCAVVQMQEVPATSLDVSCVHEALVG